MSIAADRRCNAMSKIRFSTAHLLTCLLRSSPSSDSSDSAAARPLRTSIVPALLTCDGSHPSLSSRDRELGAWRFRFLLDCKHSSLHINSSFSLTSRMPGLWPRLSTRLLVTALRFSLQKAAYLRCKASSHPRYVAGTQSCEKGPAWRGERTASRPAETAGPRESVPVDGPADGRISSASSLAH